jgi:hypothetical protein
MNSMNFQQHHCVQSKKNNCGQYFRSGSAKIQINSGQINPDLGHVGNADADPGEQNRNFVLCEEL